MAKTYAQLQQQIAKLQKEADALRAQEVANVVGRIQEAIRHYGLTADALFAKAGSRKAKVTRSGAKTVPKPVATGVKKKPSAPPKYSDGGTKTWNGIGKRPGWFVAALAAGKTAKDLEIAAPSP